MNIEQKTVLFHCHACGHGVTATRAQRNTDIVCPHCNHVTFVPMREPPLWLGLLYRLAKPFRHRPAPSKPIKTFAQIRAETVGENMGLRVIGVLRGPVHDEWDAYIREIYDATKERDGVFSVSESMTVQELLEMHPEWCWVLS